MNSHNYPHHKFSCKVSISSILVLVVILLISSLTVCSCFKLSLSEQQRLERQLEKRFTTYMKAKQGNNAEVVYSMYSKRFRRRMTLLEFAKKKMPAKGQMEVTITSFALEHMEFTNHHREAMVEFTMDISVFSPVLPIPKALDMTPNQKERWIYEQNDWYREPKRVLTNLSGNPFYIDRY